VDTVVYLTVDAVIALHTIALEVAGGIDGIRSQQQLASAVAQPQQSAFGEDLYRTVPDKAAAYGYFIAEGQPFLDGNKRTALLALETFLEANGYDSWQTTTSSRSCSKIWPRRCSTRLAFSVGCRITPARGDRGGTRPRRNARIDCARTVPARNPRRPISANATHCRTEPTTDASD
jgi:death-on-curing protein